MELDKAKLQEVVEKIAYQQTAEDQADDLFNKMGILNKYVQEQLTLTDVGKGTELLPDFLYKDDYGIKIGYHGDTEVSKEWNEYLEKIR